MKIILAGAGVKAGDLSLHAHKAAEKASVVIIRTALSEAGKDIKLLFPEAITLDCVYEKSRNFDTLAKNLAAEVLKKAKEYGDAVYIVDGTPTEDRSCAEILKKCKDAEIIGGIPKSVGVLSKLPFAADSGFYSASAYDYDGKSDGSAIIFDVDNPYIAGKVKLLLSEKYGDESVAYKVNSRGAEKTQVYELDRGDDFDYSTAFVVPVAPLTEKKRFSFADLTEILDVLRSPNGCPWDRVQTKDSVRKNVIEEAYELVDAIDSGDEDKICEEAGDLLLQVAFQCVFARERGAFTETDAISCLCRKLITRHTHVFGKDSAKDDSSALDLWNRNKAVEKGYKNGAEYLKAVPSCFPALMRAEKVGNRSKKYNMDFENADAALGKVREEIEEVKAEIAKGDKKRIEEECGDLLFAVTSYVRLSGVENELALKAATEKFIRRFEKAEELALKDGKKLEDISSEETDFYYNASKKY